MAGRSHRATASVYVKAKNKMGPRASTRTTSFLWPALSRIQQRRFLALHSSLVTFITSITYFTSITLPFTIINSAPNVTTPAADK